jgi:hypothetical protein
MRVGSGDFQYESIDHWGVFPKEWNVREVCGIAIDSRDNVYTFSRCEEPVCVFSPDGELIAHWGADIFQRPHGIFIDRDDCVYCVGDQDHNIRKFTSDGKLLLTLQAHPAGATNGFVWNDPATIQRTLPPFNFPTDAAVSGDGNIYVADGYGNACVHVFSAEGCLLFSWGQPGSGRGQFRTVHGVCIDHQGRICVADRENSRIQIFSPAGEFLEEWPEVRRPNMMATDGSGHIYITELGGSSMAMDSGTRPQPSQSRISVRGDGGRILSEWGAAHPGGADLYFAPHGIAVDSRGNVYVGEVAATYSRGRDSGRRGPLHKYALLG